ncbi:MAG: glycosyltransferase family 4 protein [Phenylobacterium sp.]|uniref:glycosyltransferase family 4 protein n=1 Tax=Phenylobacterium sp. TaxID=1871053 RepID=UPI00391BE6DF
MTPHSASLPRILMTTDAVGGVWTYALDLAAGLRQHGVRTVLAAFGPEPARSQRAQAAAIDGLELVETGMPLDWTAAEPAEIGEAAAVVRGLARRYAVDLIHLNSPALAAGGPAPAPVLGACHSCLATWWAAVREGPLPADFRWRTRSLWEGLVACDALVAPSAAYAREVARTYDLQPPSVVHNGVRQAVQAIAPAERGVFTAGRLWDAGKNAQVFDAMAARLPVPAQAAGPLESPTGERVALRHATSLGLLSADEIARRLAPRPVFVSTALYEPFGLAVLEAALAGCPLVLSDIPTFRELWDGTAVFADPRDPYAFAEAAQALLDDPEAAREAGRAAQAQARRYSLEAMTLGVLELYARLAPARFRTRVKEAAE